MPTASWVSRLVAAQVRGEISGVEMWDLVLAHLDDLAADRLIDAVLSRLRRLVDRGVRLSLPSPTAEADEPIVVADDEPELSELLAG